MKIAICDNEQIHIDNIKKHLDYFSVDNKIDFEEYTFTSAQELLKSNVKFDLAILDVEMTEMDGIKLGKCLREINPQIVLMFVTAYKQYLDDALNLNAVRFFEKPLDSQRFYRGLSDAIKRFDDSKVDVFLTNQNVKERIETKDILYVEIENRKTKVVTNKAIYHTENHISYWQKHLTSSIFAVPHKSYIVNFNYVTTYNKNYIILDGKYEIRISRSKYADFSKKFMRYVEGR